MTFKLAALAPLALVVAVGSAAAHGNVKCPAHPKAEWKPHTELHEKLTKEGWVVRRMEKTATCYEVYAKDPNGKRIEAFFDPVTFLRVE
jgi:hypothetical protein